MPTAGLASEVLIFGVVGLWLLALIPAATVTALKGQWLFFLAGWLTLGLVWFVGALSPARPDSWWARAFYDDERLSHAADPQRHPPPRRRAFIWVAGTLAAIGVLGLLGARPSPILGVDGEVLGRSVGGVVSMPNRPCHRLGQVTWRCQRADDKGSGSYAYRVEVNRSGCWTAVRIRASGEGRRRRLSGCITIVDHVLG